MNASARIQVAAELALDRCRELAGSRLRTKITNARAKEQCPDCAATIKDVPNGLVASALGDNAPDGLPIPRDLVAGGAAAFEARLIRWGADPGGAALLGSAIEQHAARTLFDPDPQLPKLRKLPKMVR